MIIKEPWKLMIDGDGIVYRAGFASDSRGGDVSHSLHNTKVIINSIIKRFSPCDVTVYLTSQNGSLNFRSRLVDDYKANRAKKCNKCKGKNLTEMEGIQRKNELIFRAFSCDDCGQCPIKDTKPVYYQEIRNYLIEKFKAKVCNWGEADDWLGTNYTKQTIIASNDKDLLMVPCHHWRITDELGITASDPGWLELLTNKSGGKSVKGVGFKWFACQLLSGDTIDNIHKPRAGFGPVAIYDYLNPLDTIEKLWIAVESFYRDCGKTDLLLTNAQLLWMARKPRQIFSLDVLQELIYEEVQRVSREDVLRS